MRKSWPQDLLPLRAKEWRHILYGLDQSGGHARGYGWRFGGTEFPRSWTEKDVLQAAETLLREHGVIEDISRASIASSTNCVVVSAAMCVAYLLYEPRCFRAVKVAAPAVATKIAAMSTSDPKPVLANSERFGE